MTTLKPSNTRPKFHLLVRHSFRAQAQAVSPRDVAAIEHMLRRGRRQIEMYEDPKVRDCWVSEEMVKWGDSNRGWIRRGSGSNKNEGGRL